MKKSFTFLGEIHHREIGTDYKTDLPPSAFVETVGLSGIAESGDNDEALESLPLTWREKEVVRTAKPHFEDKKSSLQKLNQAIKLERINMKSSFSVGSEAAKVIDVTPAPVGDAIAVTPSTALVPQVSSHEVSTAVAIPTQEMQGEFKSSDYNVPQLQVIQGVGPMKVKFPKNEGAFVLNKEVLLTKGVEVTTPQAVQLTVSKFRKQIIENLPYGDDSVGAARVVDTEEEAIALGGVLSWDEDEKGKRVPPTWVPIASALCVINAPAGLEEDPLFSFEFDGKRYAVAVWRLRSTAYTTCARAIISASGFALNQARGGLCSGSWLATTKYEKRGMNYVHVPSISQVTVRNTPEFAAFCREITAM